MPIILNRIISIESSRQLTTKYLETYYRASKPFIINTTTLFRFKCPIYDVESEENRSSIIFKKTRRTSNVSTYANVFHKLLQLKIIRFSVRRA